MSSKTNDLLKKSSYEPKVICLYADKDQQSDIESDDSSSQKRNPISNQTTKNSSPPRVSNKCLSEHKISLNIEIAIKQKPLIVKKCSSNLLQPPSMDYAEKSQIYQEKRIEQRVTRLYEKESFFGKRKEKVIEISDVSSESDSQSLKVANKKPVKKRKFNESEDQDEILQKYSIGDFKPQKPKKKQINLDESQNELDNLQHLHPDYEQEKKGPASEKGSDNFSEMNSDDSLIIIRPKHKHTHKRLKKMVNMTNRVKIQSKQNNGQTQDCPICLTDLNKKDQKKKGKLPCNHLFCLKCITESSKFSNKCPYCRATFNEIRCKGRRIQVENTRVNQQEFEDPNDEPCYICGRNNDFERLLECEFCEYAYCHTYCDPRLRDRVLVAEDPWYCASCEQLMRHRMENGEDVDEEVIQEEEDDDDDEVVEEQEIVEIQPVGRRNIRRQSNDEYQASDQDDF